jgi:multiple sugar transport system ATP-binding protein
VGVRPENWRLTSKEEGGMPVEVTVIEELGADGFVYGTSDVEGTPSTVIVRVSKRQHASPGDVIHVTTDPEHVHVFGTETGERLSA